MMEKLLSGRFWLAIMAGIALLLMVNWPEPPREAICSIVATIVGFYFGKKDNAV